MDINNSVRLPTLSTSITPVTAHSQLDSCRHALIRVFWRVFVIPTASSTVLRYDVTIPVPHQEHEAAVKQPTNIRFLFPGVATRDLQEATLLAFWASIEAMISAISRSTSGTYISS
ncbi:hypothetical protein OGATHE_005985 [Ogataea polymorpha]|uniref:Uncharacterized protein n=1 Tax=Ogataea polymorpha TaxID=460523 RepID=A0A9P8NUG2_9ASCO|nr:hypothetical protein OGATHE_005985 [Ogataea polymorpha]